jgi:hypothetical protein
LTTCSPGWICAPAAARRPGDEPFEAQPLVAAGKGTTLTHDLTVVVSGRRLVIRPLAGGQRPPARHPAAGG